MKRLLFTIGYAWFMLSPDADDSGAPAPKQYTSEKLTEIRAAKKAKLAEMKAEMDEDKAFELNTQLFKLGADERAEIASLKAAELNAENEAKRAAKVKQLADLIAMGAANDAVQADKKATDETKAASKLAYDAAFDAIANQLLGSVAKVSAPKADGKEGNGAQKEQIVEWYKAHRASGKDHTAALKAVTDENGVARGSAWGPVDAYRKSIGEKA